jgi:hypothetical protein
MVRKLNEKQREELATQLFNMVDGLNIIFMVLLFIILGLFIWSYYDLEKCEKNQIENPLTDLQKFIEENNLKIVNQSECWEEGIKKIDWNHSSYKQIPCGYCDSPAGCLCIEWENFTEYDAKETKCKPLEAPYSFECEVCEDKNMFLLYCDNLEGLEKLGCEYRNKELINEYCEICKKGEIRIKVEK